MRTDTPRFLGFERRCDDGIGRVDAAKSMVPWSLGPLVPWSRGPWSRGPVVLWSQAEINSISCEHQLNSAHLNLTQLNSIKLNQLFFYEQRQKIFPSATGLITGQSFAGLHCLPALPSALRGGNPRQVSSPSSCYSGSHRLWPCGTRGRRSAHRRRPSRS